MQYCIGTMRHIHTDDDDDDNDVNRTFRLFCEIFLLHFNALENKRSTFFFAKCILKHVMNF